MEQSKPKARRCAIYTRKSSEEALNICRLLPPNAHPSLTRQGLPRPAPGHATEERKSHRHSTSQWPASPLRTSRRLIRPRFLLTTVLPRGRSAVV